MSDNSSDEYGDGSKAGTPAPKPTTKKETKVKSAASTAANKSGSWTQEQEDFLVELKLQKKNSERTSPVVWGKVQYWTYVYGVDKEVAGMQRPFGAIGQRGSMDMSLFCTLSWITPC